MRLCRHCDKPIKDTRVYCRRLCRLLDKRRAEYLYRRKPSEGRYDELYRIIAKMMPVCSLTQIYHRRFN